MKRLAILTTGGTIAMRADAGGAAQVSLRAEDLLNAAPRLREVAQVALTDVLAIPSASFGLADLRKIAQVANAAGDADGIVVTHGTDTLEETAFALTLTVTHDTPVVLTGAMRRFDQPGADGAANLEAAGLTAVDPASRGKGVLVVMDDEIHSGPLVRKAHAFRTHAFSSAPFGPIGWVAEGAVRYALTPAIRYPTLSVGAREAVVPIIEAGPGLEPQVIATLTDTVDALVLSLPGAGHVAARAVEALETLAAKKPVVFGSRTGAGRTLAASYGYAGSETDLIARGLIPAGALDARKARVLLLMVLSNGASVASVRETFAALP